MRYAVPVIFIAVMLTAAIKRVNVFSAFSRGAEDAVKFLLKLIPLISCTFIMCELFERSRLSEYITTFISPALHFVGVPTEITKLMLIKPFSGSGSLAYLTDILSEYGADGYIGRCACVAYGCSETTFYISAVYFAESGSKNKRLVPIILALVCSHAAVIIGCQLCRII